MRRTWRCRLGWHRAQRYVLLVPGAPWGWQGLVIGYPREIVIRCARCNRLLRREVET